MMEGAATIEGGFAEVGAGAWLVGRAQPAAFFGNVARRRRKGWVVRDRGRLDLVETSGAMKCADATRPFLTHIPCAARVFAVSDKVLLAPASARTGAEVVKVIPMSVRGSICVTAFDLPKDDPSSEPPNHRTTEPHNSSWVVMATASRTARVQVGEGDTLSVRPDAAVAWTGNHPTGFCPKLGLFDILLPRGPKDLLLHFHGPCVVWIEGSNNRAAQLPPYPYARRPC